MKAGESITLERERGAILIGTLFCILILSILLMGIGTYATSHYQRAVVDSNYAEAMDAAEAGVNWELSKISASVNNADTSWSPTQALGNEYFTVKCTNRDGVTPWDKSSPLYVFAVGSCGLASRTIRVSVKGYTNSSPQDFAVFSIGNGLISTLNGHVSIAGNLGTNGYLTVNGNCGISGGVSFNGSQSGWTGTDPGTYSEVYNTNPVLWPTVQQVANQVTGTTTGMNYLATHNDNSMCSFIQNNVVLLNGSTVGTFVGKPGGANYYLTSLILSGSSKIAFDNTSGPINIWVGPPGSNGSCVINGGNSLVSMSTNPDNAVRIYCDTTTGVTLNGNDELDAGVYAYDVTSGGTPYGQIINNGTPTVNGSLMSNTVTLNGTVNINHVTGYFQGNTSTIGYYGYDNSWMEINGR